MAEAPKSPHFTLDGYVVDENAINRQIYGTYQVSSTQIRYSLLYQGTIQFPFQTTYSMPFQRVCTSSVCKPSHLLLAVWQINSLSVYGPRLLGRYLSIFVDLFLLSPLPLLILLF